jgi:hypothetical protein
MDWPVATFSGGASWVGIQTLPGVDVEPGVFIGEGPRAGIRAFPAAGTGGAAGWAGAGTGTGEEP